MCDVQDEFVAAVSVAVRVVHDAEKGIDTIVASLVRNPSNASSFVLVVATTYMSYKDTSTNNNNNADSSNTACTPRHA